MDTPKDPLHKLSIVIECSDEVFGLLEDRVYSLLETEFVEPEWEIQNFDDSEDLEQYRNTLSLPGTGELPET